MQRFLLTFAAAFVGFTAAIIHFKCRSKPERRQGRA
jgi:hypothetical protein